MKQLAEPGDEPRVLICPWMCTAADREGAPYALSLTYGVQEKGRLPRGAIRDRWSGGRVRTTTRDRVRRQDRVTNTTLQPFLTPSDIMPGNG